MILTSDVETNVSVLIQTPQEAFSQGVELAGIQGSKVSLLSKPRNKQSHHFVIENLNRYARLGPPDMLNQTHDQTCKKEGLECNAVAKL